MDSWRDGVLTILHWFQSKIILSSISCNYSLSWKLQIEVNMAWMYKYCSSQMLCNFLIIYPWLEMTAIHFLLLLNNGKRLKMKNFLSCYPFMAQKHSRLGIIKYHPKLCLTGFVFKIIFFLCHGNKEQVIFRRGHVRRTWLSIISKQNTKKFWLVLFDFC